MLNRVLLSWLVVAIGGLAGCASLAYQVKVNGYTDPAASVPLSPGVSIFVIDNQAAKNPLLEKEIKGKINKLLEQQGYRIATFDQADYYLFFGYGIGPERQVTVVMPDYFPTFGLGLGAAPLRSPYFFVSPFLSYYPPAESLYDRWLLINVVDGRFYREKGEFRALWVGEARSTGTSSDLRTVINYLLVADFTEFGRNTGKAVTVDINEQDPRVKALIR